MFAPVAVSVAVCPAQIVAVFAVTVGNAKTVTVDDKVLVQLFTSVTVAVKTVLAFMVGVMLTVLAPLLQL